MRWTSGDRSNVEDMRGRSGGRAMGAGGLGVGGLLLLLVLSWATGIDLTSIVGGGSPAPAEPAGTTGKVTASPEEEKMVDMVDAVMDDEEVVDSYLLSFWPAPPMSDRIVKQTSDAAAYWHGLMAT